MLEFKKVTLEDKNIINGHLRKYGSSSCQHSLYLMCGLSMKYGDEYAFFDDVLYIHRSNLDYENTRVYLAPLGDIESNFKKYVNVILDDAKVHRCSVSFITGTEEFKNLLVENFPKEFHIEESRDYAEYIYSTESLSVLSGRPLAPKRNRVRAFYSTYEGNIRIENISSENLDDVRTFQTEWITQRLSEGYDEMLCRENKAIKYYLDHFDELEFKGIIVYVKGTVVGYAAGVPLNDECMDEVIEKGRKDVTGIYQLLCNEFALLCCQGYKYINREEDLGVEGLRRAKESYNPEYLLNKYVITSIQ